MHHGKRIGTQYTRVRVSLLSIATAKSSLGPGTLARLRANGETSNDGGIFVLLFGHFTTLPTLPALAPPAPRPRKSPPVAELADGRCLRCQHRRHDDWTQGPPVIDWTARGRPARDSRNSRRVPVPRAESLHPMIPSTQQATNLDGFEVAIGLFSIAPRF